VCYMVFAAFFAIVVGLGMVAQWTMSYVNKQIPELTSEPIRIAFHLAAEMATALMLITAGIGLLNLNSWAAMLYPLSMGMLLYTAIVSPGYFAQRGNWAWLGMFGAIALLAILSLILVSPSMVG